MKHAFRNSLVPIITSIGTTLGFLLTGSFIIESFFRIPGLGLKSVNAIYQGDYPIVQGTVLLFAVLFILVNLVVDILLPLLDPRIKVQA
jgi:peptide/nickel transport system permease protein